MERKRTFKTNSSPRQFHCKVFNFVIENRKEELLNGWLEIKKMSYLKILYFNFYNNSRKFHIKFKIKLL